MSDKVEVIKEWPSPKSLHELRSSMGLTGYYQNFVYHYAEICRPFTEVTNTGVRFRLSKEFQESFDLLKSLLTREPLSIHGNPGIPYNIYTYSSRRSIGGAICQDMGNGHHHVGLESRLITVVEINYQVHEQELSAVVYCLQKRRHLVEVVH